MTRFGARVLVDVLAAAVIGGSMIYATVVRAWFGVAVAAVLLALVLRDLWTDVARRVAERRERSEPTKALDLLA